MGIMPSPEEIKRFQEIREIFENELSGIERAILISYFGKTPLASSLKLDLAGLTKQLYILFSKPNLQEDIGKKVRSFRDAHYDNVQRH